MAKSDVLLVSSPRFVDHRTPGGHPERPARAEVMARVAERWAATGGPAAAPAPVSDQALARVHDGRYLEDIASTAGRRVRLDPDTWTSPDSEAVARLAAGATVAAVDHALDRGAPGLAFVRPPGHHAERARAMGFCLYNNAAVAAAHALARGLERIAVIDYDVHHGNGIQWIFYDDSRVLYVSTHQYPFYPGTGAADDVGRDDGAGTTVNVPLAAGAGDADLDRVFREVVMPILAGYAPDAVLLSAGFDAHADDPLGGMQLSTDGYAILTRRLWAFAAERCAGRLAVVTEGGYDLQALEECLDGTLEVCAADPPASIPPVRGSTSIAAAALQSVTRAQSPYWPGVG
ncbi:MAG: histone deacetylase [Acidobacteria bacterium]|nr:histone deacetylase [Acidobacteriota bacterium]